ncbi:MAG: hypothetical protein ABJH82_02560 [Polaribacter sp.]|uniref:hypothetical protein n=1 Tax=Polaribacter sp. TaxID=1920175 RepID=UPI003263945C
MKTKFNGILTLLQALVVQINFAQEKTKDNETEFNGKYSIKIKPVEISLSNYLRYKLVEKTESIQIQYSNL